MTTFAITAGDISFSTDITDPAQLAALTAVREKNNAALTLAEGQARTDHPDYSATDGAYLNKVLTAWTVRNPGATEQDVRGTLARALASYAGQNPPEVLVAEPGPPSVATLLAYAADRRWRKEVGGTVVAGILVPTDDRAKILIMGAAQSMQDADTAPFVVGSTSVTLTGAQFKAMYAGIVAHVAACFAIQQAVIAAITSDPPTITDKAGIDAAFA